MANKMLIDASHREETRVVVTHGSRIEEFDFESADRKQLRGNIYLARVTRVEPSLQAAFVEYGGNRHGFLAFNEIHPDYYQIPVADRQAILRADQEAHDAEEDEADGDAERSERGRQNRRRRGGKGRSDDNGENGSEAAEADDESADAGEAPEAMAESADADVVSEEPRRGRRRKGGAPKSDDNGDDGESGGVVEVSAANGDEAETIESVGAEDALEEVPSRRKIQRRQYKIQEVIKRRQILLVQVVKEERGNKGAALTTYLSLAGRYSVLMPNTARGGGISRKITALQDRKRLKDVVKDLDVPQGMGVILRTAGANRTKVEIKRDYEYLMRLWENVRTLTLQSTAPALVYEEGSLIKRAVRDLYNKDIEEIVVAGEEAYREAKDFMRMLMPSHAKMVQPYRDITPIFARAGIEAQLDKLMQPQVTLKSGGYIIINQTEALVAIDVNSGRSTKEHSIENTALQTNLEAAEEVARQLRLRDLAGLIVIDFIDMEEKRNNRSVEKRLKDCLKNDRARIQVGHISHFGLMEMSRQRIRSSVLESTTQTCPHCGGTGHVRSDSSVALHVLRAIEEFLLKDPRNHLTVKTSAATALYVLNHKRANLVELETRFNLTIMLEADQALAGQHYLIVRGMPVDKPVIIDQIPLPSASAFTESDEEDEIVEETADDTADEAAEPAIHARSDPRAEPRDGEDGDRSRKRRRRRRRRGGRDRDGERGSEDAVQAGETESGDAEGDEGDDAPAAVTEAAEAPDAEAAAKKRRRGKRGGRNARKDGGEAVESAADAPAFEVEPSGAIAETAPAEPVAEDMPVEEPAAKPKRKAAAKPAAKTAAKAAEKPAAKPRAKKAKDVPAAEPAAEAENAKDAPAVVTEEPAAPEERAPRSRRKPAAESAPVTPVVTSVLPAAAEPEAEKPRKGGWWQKKGFF